MSSKKKEHAEYYSLVANKTVQYTGNDFFLSLVDKSMMPQLVLLTGSHIRLTHCNVVVWFGHNRVNGL